MIIKNKKIDLRKVDIDGRIWRGFQTDGTVPLRIWSKKTGRGHDVDLITCSFVNSAGLPRWIRRQVVQKRFLRAIKTLRINSMGCYRECFVY